MLKKGLALFLCLLPASGCAQKTLAPPLIVEQPDAERTRGEMSNLLSRYPRR